MAEIFAGLPPWLIPALIVHAVYFLVLVVPTWIAFSRAGVSGSAALALLFPVLGLIAVAVMLAIRVLPRANWSAALALVMIVPVVNLFLIWPLAFAKSWDGRRAKAPKPAARPPAPAQAAPELPSAPAGEHDDPATIQPPRSARRARGKGATYREGPPPSLIAAESLPDQSVDPRTLRPRAPVAPVAPGDAPDAAGDDATILPRAAGKPEAATDATPVEASAIEPPPPAAPKIEDIEDKDAAAAPVEPEVPIDAASLTPPPAEKPPAETPPAEKPPAEKPPAASVDDESATMLAGGERPAEPNHRTVSTGAHWRLKGTNARAADIDVIITLDELAEAEAGLSVGRSSRAAIKLADESISRNHARFVLSGTDLAIEDMDSMNGTWVEGEKLKPNTPTPVRAGMELEFGKLRLSVSDR